MPENPLYITQAQLVISAHIVGYYAYNVHVQSVDDRVLSTDANLLLLQREDNVLTFNTHHQLQGACGLSIT